MSVRIKELDKDNHPGFLGIRENVRDADDECSECNDFEDGDIARDGDVFAEWGFPHPGAFFKRGTFLRKIAKELHVSIYEAGCTQPLYIDNNGTRGEQVGTFTAGEQAVGYHA